MSYTCTGAFSIKLFQSFRRLHYMSDECYGRFNNKNQFFLILYYLYRHGNVVTSASEQRFNSGDMAVYK